MFPAGVAVGRSVERSGRRADGFLLTERRVVKPVLTGSVDGEGDSDGDDADGGDGGEGDGDCSV